EHVDAGEHPRHPLCPDLRGARAALPQEPLPRRGTAAFLAVSVSGHLSIQIRVLLLPVCSVAAGVSPRPAAGRTAEPIRNPESAAGGRHRRRVRAAVGICDGKARDAASADDFGAGCPLSADASAAGADAEPLERWWTSDLLHA